MADRMWFDHKAGELPVNREEGCILMGDTTPDVVRLPTELGGTVLKVLSAFQAECPVTGNMCRHLELEQGYFVAQSDRFYWYKRKEQKNAGVDRR